MFTYILEILDSNTSSESDILTFIKTIITNEFAGI